VTTVDTLTAAEADLLATAEAVIERGLTTFVEVGDALMQVRENRLYRGTHDTFESYTRDRWGFSDSRARQLIGAAQTVTNVTEAGLPAPANEGQARALNAVPAEERADVWADTIARTDGKPTAAAVAETVKHRPLWKCAGCGEVTARVRAPKNCPTCQCPHFDDVIAALAAEPVAPERQLVYIRRNWDGEEYHQVFPKGDVTFCQQSTIGGHVLPVGVLVERYASKPCATCWPADPAPAAVERRWECQQCANTFTGPRGVIEGGEQLTARCPQCGGWHTTDLGLNEPADDDTDKADDEPVVSSHCTSCGNVENLEMTPPYCSRCGVAPAQIKTGLTADAGHDVVDRRCRTCAPLDNPGERVYTAWLRDGQPFCRLREAGTKTVCGARIDGGHILTRRNLLKDHAAVPCKYGCWPELATEPAAPEAEPVPVFDGVHATADAWEKGALDGAGAKCTCSMTISGFDSLVEAVAAMERHVAEKNEAASPPDAETPAEANCCEKCGTPLIPGDVALGMLRCEDCDDQGDHIGIDGGPCQVCFPDGETEADEPAPPAAPAEDVTVWMAADRRGLAYHRLQEHAPWTGCARHIAATGRVMPRAEAVGQIGGKPCRACYPGGDPDPAPVEAPDVELEPAPPVLEGEVVPAKPGGATPAVEVLPDPPKYRTGKLDVAECKALELQFIRGDWLLEFTTDFDAAQAKCAAGKPGQRSVSDWPQSTLETDFEVDGVRFSGGGYREEGLITWDRIADSLEWLTSRAPHVHFQTLIDACSAFDTAIQDVDTDLAVAGFNIHGASKITQAIALGQWCQEYMELVEQKLRPAAPDAKGDGQMPGQLDILTEAVSDDADR
jgi:hypothetical protein